MTAPGRFRWLGRFGRDEAGTTLVEFALVMALLLLLFFGLIDFGRLSYSWVAAEKATGIAARIASVRPPACAGVPDSYGRGGNSAPAFGSDCGGAPGTCAIPASVTCSGSAGDATASEIWTRIRDLLPPDATIAALQFRYGPDFDDTDGAADMVGFLGGPYVPAVTVELTGLTFRFATPLGGLANLASGTTGAAIPTDIPIPAMSVSLPGEDLALGTAG